MIVTMVMIVTIVVIVTIVDIGWVDGESKNEGKRKQAACDNLEVVHGSLFRIIFTRKTLSLHLRNMSQCGLHIFDAIGISVKGG